MHPTLLICLGIIIGGILIGLIYTFRAFFTPLWWCLSIVTWGPYYVITEDLRGKGGNNLGAGFALLGSYCIVAIHVLLAIGFAFGRLFVHWFL